MIRKRRLPGLVNLDFEKGDCAKAFICFKKTRYFQGRNIVFLVAKKITLFYYQKPSMRIITRFGHFWWFKLLIQCISYFCLEWRVNNFDGIIPWESWKSQVTKRRGPPTFRSQASQVTLFGRLKQRDRDDLTKNRLRASFHYTF